jgi:hypothetical protein
MKVMWSFGTVGTTQQHHNAEHNTTVRTSDLGKQNLCPKSKKEFQMLGFAIIFHSSVSCRQMTKLCPVINNHWRDQVMEVDLQEEAVDWG